ncbi:MAG: hypothetical protein SA378_02085 [Sedimentibacter sp.]|uniref:hypothetical protein n=1 Tax=Sedimentibacter sp. TaxID=1960295 RepID=UPI0029824FD8|nr:hypothetical protein [Sedimentibacter sp.]MDW5298917.1 hypothetical protein [Sedimentibacter sp.]
MNKDKFGFEKLDISNMEEVARFDENPELYPENDRIQMLRSLPDLVKDIIENIKKEERSEKLLPVFNTIVKIFASFSK